MSQSAIWIMGWWETCNNYSFVRNCRGVNKQEVGRFKILKIGGHNKVNFWETSSNALSGGGGCSLKIFTVILLSKY